MKILGNNIHSRLSLAVVMLYVGLIVLFSAVGTQANPQSIAIAAQETTANEMFMTSLLTYSLSGLPLLFIALYFVKRETKKITSSLSTAMNSLDEIAIGNFEFQSDNIQNDETSHLMKAMQTTSEKVKGIILPIDKSIQTLSPILDKIKNTGVQYQNLSAEQTQITSGLSHQLNTLFESLSNSKINNGADSHNNTDDTEMKQALDDIQTAIRSIESVESDVEQVATIIMQLQTSSNAIGSVVDTINQIANQTNMLALNAAIEAARAGEQGRGFAVVADEVRSLSLKTHDATTEIQDTIKKIQLDTNLAVDAIGKTKLSVSHESADPSNSLDLIQRYITESNSGSPQHNAASFQSTDYESINESTRQLNQNSQELETLFHSLISQTNALNQPVDELTEKLSTFKKAERFSIASNKL